MDKFTFLTLYLDISRQISSFSDKFTFPFLNLDLSDKNRQFRINSLFSLYTWTCQTKIVKYGQNHFFHSIPGLVGQKSSFLDKFTFPFQNLDLSDKNCQFRTNLFFPSYTWTCQTKIVIFGQIHFSIPKPGPVRQKSSNSDKFTFLTLYLDLSDKNCQIWTNSLFSRHTCCLDLSDKNHHFRTNSLSIPKLGPVRQRSSISDKFIFPFLYLDLSDKNRQFPTKSLFSLYTWTYQTKIVIFGQIQFSFSIPGPV